VACECSPLEGTDTTSGTDCYFATLGRSLNKYWTENLPVHPFVFSTDTAQGCTDSCRFRGPGWEGRGEDSVAECDSDTQAQDENGQCKTCSEISKNDNFCCLEDSDDLCCQWDGILFDPVRNDLAPYGINTVQCAVPGCEILGTDKNEKVQKFFCADCEENGDWPYLARGFGTCTYDCSFFGDDLYGDNGVCQCKQGYMDISIDPSEENICINCQIIDSHCSSCEGLSSPDPSDDLCLACDSRWLMPSVDQTSCVAKI